MVSSKPAADYNATSSPGSSSPSTKAEPGSPGAKRSRASSRAASATTQCTWAGVYCDDIIAIFGDDDVGSVYDGFRTALHTRWKAEDEGELSDILNICVAHEGSSIKLSQPTYIDTMVDRYTYPMTSCRRLRYKRHLTRYTSRTTSRPRLPPRQQPIRHRTLPYSPNTNL